MLLYKMVYKKCGIVNKINMTMYVHALILYYVQMFSTILEFFVFVK